MKTSSETRMIYLIRHGEPALDTDEPVCLGDSPVPLSLRGMRQAEQAGQWLQEKEIRHVFTSPYRRCVQTAELIAEQLSGKHEVQTRTGLREVDTGRWNNRTFREIRQTDEEAWKQRGLNLGTEPIPEGESFEIAGKRFRATVFEILNETEGNLAVIAHAGVIRAFICLLTGKDLNTLMEVPQPYGGITVLASGLSLRETASQKTVLQETGIRPEFSLDREEIRYLWNKYRTPDPVAAHMEAVEKYLKEILMKIDPAGLTYNHTQLERAALLHDLKRTEKKHVEAGALALVKEGYPEVADLVRQHHDGSIPVRQPLTAGDLLFYADKRVRGTEPVSLQERFETSIVKCKSDEARAQHRMQRERAGRIEERLKKCINNNRF